jgi:hypothetical protein
LLEEKLTALFAANAIVGSLHGITQTPVRFIE